MTEREHMVYRTMGRTGLRVSVVGLGTGGQSRLGQATHGDQRESARVVQRALELGINLFDTAPGYADTEELLAKALRGVPRADYMIATKVTVVGRNGLLKPDDVRASCERSLRRLRTDYIDGFQFHNVGPENYPAVREHLYPAALQLQEQGKVRFIGLTERMEGRNQTSSRPAGDAGHEAIARALADEIWDTVGVKYGILNQAAEREVLPMAWARNIGVLNMSSARVKLVRPDQLEALVASWKARGLLSRDALPHRDPLAFLVHDGVQSVIAAGYKFAMDHEAISSVVIGTGSTVHLEENVTAFLSGPLPHADRDRLRKLFGHIVEGV